MVNLVISFNSLVPKPNYSDRNACANNIVPDQTAPRSSLIWDHLFTFLLTDDYRMDYSVSSNGRFNLRNSALKRVKGREKWVGDIYYTFSLKINICIVCTAMSLEILQFNPLLHTSAFGRH